ncbi:MAG: Sir2 family NAD-dependent protein deacetylase [bacterium]
MWPALKDAANAIAHAKVVIGFTGAGISTESGIPDFRTMGEFWEGFDPATFEVEIDNREAFEKNPEKVWRFFSQAIAVMEQARPNDGHRALARLGQLGRLAAIITQNVEGLHQRAGSENVIEFHGSILMLHCLRCHAACSWDEVRDKEIPPRCRCGYVLKPQVPLFGDEVNVEAFSAAQVLAMNAQVMLVAGSHGAIAPVNRIPLLAKEHGAVIVEVNRDKSLYTDRYTDFFLQGRTGEVLPLLVAEVEKILSALPGG